MAGRLVGAMTVYLVGAGPGAPGLLTRRGAELLESADVVVHDRLVSPELLELAPDRALVVDVGKRPGDARHQEHINEVLIEHGRRGVRVVRLKGGDPFVFGRGGEEAMALQEAGVDFEVVPGVSAALAVPAAAGVPVTHRGLSTSVTVVTGRVGDPSAGGVDWESLGRAGGTIVILMGMEHRAEIASRLLAAGRDPATHVAIVQWGTTARQRTVRCRLDQLSEAELGAPATVVVGPVAGLELTSALRPLAGRSVVVTRAADRADALAAALVDAGAQVLRLPVVRTAEPDDGGQALAAAMAGAGRARWLVFTSPVAVDRALAHVPDVRALAGVSLAVVGPATAAALGRHHLVPDVVAEPATAEGLVGSLPAAGAAGGSVLFPCAAGAAVTVADGLGAKGWVVEQVVAYRTEPVTDVPADDLAAAAEADAIVVTSPSTVDALVALAGASLRPAVVCIGPVTTAAARRAGLAVAAEAAKPTPAALVAAVAAALSVGV